MPSAAPAWCAASPSTWPSPRRSATGSPRSAASTDSSSAPSIATTTAIADYDLAAALRLVTLKLVGYAETVHALAPRFTPDASVLLYGGLALRRPYPGSTTVSTVNGGITGLVHTLAVELAPVRVNGIHPGIVGDSPHWAGKPASVLEAVVDRTPIGRLATMAELADASIFLLENGAVNGVNLDVDGGWLLC